VGILAYRTFETYAGILGTAWAGGTYVPLNPKQPAARLESILRRAGLGCGHRR
jgi:non-ribosomal peptide synthetase component F